MPLRHVLITGASSGLGRGLALHYAGAGAVVHALARRRPELESLAAEAAGRKAPGQVVPAVVDVGDAEALVQAIRAAEQSAGGALDLVVANAGVGVFTPAYKMDWRTVKQILDVNVVSACVTMAAALPAMVAAGRGTVVGMASLAAFRGFPRNGSYCASKAALHTFMESVRIDLRRTGVRAITVYPGFVKTEMTARNRFRMPFLMELDDAVRIMAKGIDRGDPVIAFPAPMVALMRALRALPRAIYEPMVAQRRRKSSASPGGPT